MDEIKQRALELANNSGAPVDDVVARAEKYEKFLRGQTGATETPLPVTEGGQPDALQG